MSAASECTHPQWLRDLNRHQWLCANCGASQPFTDEDERDMRREAKRLKFKEPRMASESKYDELIRRCPEAKPILRDMFPGGGRVKIPKRDRSELEIRNGIMRNAFTNATQVRGLSRAGALEEIANVHGVSVKTVERVIREGERDD